MVRFCLEIKKKNQKSWGCTSVVENLWVQSPVPQKKEKEKEEKEKRKKK